MSQFEEPEILRVSLSSAVLRLKSHFKDSPVLSDVQQVLKETMAPPPDQSVSSAFEELIKIGALQYKTSVDEKEKNYKETYSSPLGMFLR